jgi:hypothetical protein
MAVKLDDSFWPHPLRHCVHPLVASADEEVTIGEISGEAVEGFAGNRMLFTDCLFGFRRGEGCRQTNSQNISVRPTLTGRLDRPTVPGSAGTTARVRAIPATNLSSVNS